MAPPTGELIGDVSHQVELLGRDRAGRQLDPHHLVGAALTLAVDAVIEPQYPKDVLPDVAAEVLGYGQLEAFDVALLLGIEVARCTDDGGDTHGRASGDSAIGNSD